MKTKSSKTIIITAVAVLLVAAAIGFKGKNSPREEDFEKLIVKSFGSPVVEFHPHLKFHGPNYQAGLFFACDTKIFQDLPSKELPAKQKEKISAIEKYKCNTANDQSTIYPILFLGNPPRSPTDGKYLKLHVELMHPLNGTPIELYTVKIDFGSTHFPKNISKIVYQSSGIETSKLPESYAQDGVFTLRGFVEDQVAGRNLEFSQTLTIGKDV